MHSSVRDDHSKRGFALILVLGITALLVVMVVTFLGATTKHVANSQADTDFMDVQEWAQTGYSQVLGDILQEIRAGSIVGAPGTAPLVLYPATPLSAEPDRSSASRLIGGIPVTPPNLVKQSSGDRFSFDKSRSFNGRAVYPQAATYPPVSRASSVSTDGAGGIPSTSWNAPLLLPRADSTSATDVTPAIAGVSRYAGNASAKWEWKRPDWVYLRRDGSTPTTWSQNLNAGSPNPVTARYAFQLYDIGGLLDANVAGYDPDPSVVGGSLASRRGSIGFADLTQVGLNASHLKKLVDFRNPATLAQPDGGRFGNRYANFLLNNQLNNHFLRVSGGSSVSTPSNRAFQSRSQLIAYFKTLAATKAESAQVLELLQSLTHFSRGLEQPSFKPGFYDPDAAGSTTLSPVFVRPSIVPPAGRVDDRIYPVSLLPTTLLSSGDVRRANGFPLDMPLGNNRGGNDAWGTLKERGVSATDTRALQDVINPGLLEVRVLKSFTRQDGSTANPGEPLVKKRFPLERLAWLTCKGPSALLPITDPLYNSEGTAKAIYDCLGLTWSTDAEGVNFWAYSHGKTGGIFKLEDLLVTDAAKGLPREPDFFELLKAGIAVGSLGKASSSTHVTSYSWDTATYQQSRDRKSEFQLLEIGANLIDQYDADSFPTTIRLPNLDSSLTTEAARYYPPLFTARGVEDLPYFYRFHWRGIEDKNDRPSIALPNPGGPTEITDNLASFVGSNFKCGTTVVMGFPELWNPHAVAAGSVIDPAKTPARFRVVAASEAPGDVVEPPRNPSDVTDKGLASIPRLGTASTPSLTDPWVKLVNSAVYDFAVKPMGFLGYANGNSWCPSLLHNAALATNAPGNSYPMLYTSNSQTWSWPIDALQSIYLAAPNQAYSLFWTGAPSSPDPSTPSLGDRVSNVFLAAAPLWKIPAVTASGTMVLQASPYSSWPSTAVLYSGTFSNGTKKTQTATSLADLPTLGSSQSLYLVAGTPYIWTGGTYKLLSYPATPEVSSVALTHGYTIRPSALLYTSGKAVPDPFPPYQVYLRALTDKPGVRRTFFETNPKYITPPATPSADKGGDAHANRTVDLRGSELLFTLGNSGLFREPTTLCQPNLPIGSTFAAGTDNFYSGAPYGGYVEDLSGTRWVGISLGEVPSQFLLATKLYTREREAVYNNASYPSAGLKWANSVNPPVDLAANRKGQNVLPVYGTRYFQVPVTVAGVTTTRFTIRLQFEDTNHKWVTYDERFINIDGGDNARYSSSAVMGKSELEPTSPGAPQSAAGDVAWKDNNRPLSWCVPLVTSYDPRTSRFGHPMRYGYNWPNTLRGPNATYLQALNPTTANPSGFAPNAGNMTDRPGATFVDLSTSSKPSTVTPRYLAPAWWNSWFMGGSGNGTNLPDAYNAGVGINPPNGTSNLLWWAAAKDTNGAILFQKPSGNAMDYGWFPRLHTATGTLAGSTALPVTYSGGFKTGVSPDKTLPHFAQDAAGVTNFADSLRIGSFSENIAPSAATALDPTAPYRQAYADPDDVVRRASGGLASSGSYSSLGEGLPMGQTANNAPNRPVVLNRPFRSVAEMGYAFRGGPWKNVTFFLPETGDAALLDLFSLSEAPPLRVSSGSVTVSAPPLVAGKLNLNTRNDKVLAALLAGTLKDEFNLGETLSAGTEAVKAANALLDRTTGTKPWQGPLTNIAELAGKLFGRDLTGISASDPVYTATVYRTSTEPSRNADIQAGKTQLTWHFTGYSADLDTAFGSNKDRKNQRMRESALRALADGGQTRVWNLMLDLIVQTGRLGKQATSLNPFQKSAEARVWVYLAIDRFTGEVLDRQFEWVTE